MQDGLEPTARRNLAQSSNTDGTLLGTRRPARLKMQCVGKGAQPASKEHPLRGEAGNRSQSDVKQLSTKCLKTPLEFGDQHPPKDAMSVPPHAAVHEVVS